MWVLYLNEYGAPFHRDSQNWEPIIEAVMMLGMDGENGDG